MDIRWWHSILKALHLTTCLTTFPESPDIVFFAINELHPDFFYFYLSNLHFLVLLFVLNSLYTKASSNFSTLKVFSLVLSANNNIIGKQKRPHDLILNMHGKFIDKYREARTYCCSLDVCYDDKEWISLSSIYSDS